MRASENTLVSFVFVKEKRNCQKEISLEISLLNQKKLRVAFYSNLTRFSGIFSIESSCESSWESSEVAELAPPKIEELELSELVPSSLGCFSGETETLSGSNFPFPSSSTKISSPR